MYRSVPLFAAVALLATPAYAQSPGTSQSQFVSALQRCQGITEQTARLACFDAAASTLVGAATRGEVAIIDREQVRETRRSLFGFSLPRLPALSGIKDKRADEEPKELVSTLTSFRAAASPDRYRFSIAEGNALWETTEAAPMSDPNIGDKVTIQRGALGSYFVQIGNERWVRARRVR